MRDSLHSLIRYARRRHFVYDAKRRFSYVASSVQIVGMANVRIGASCTISDDTWLNANFRRRNDPEIIIGDHSHVGRSNFFSSGPIIDIGSFFFSGHSCRLLGCGHDVASPSVPYLAAGLSRGAPIHVEPNCWLTTAVTVLEGVRIGRGSVIGANSTVRRDIPPFSMAWGVSAEVRRRYSFKRMAWVSLESWDEEDEVSLPSLSDYEASLRSDYGKLRAPLLAVTRDRGWL
jgi:acetyltransferase-like isoleucine patch superfamily enzyme